MPKGSTTGSELPADAIVVRSYEELDRYIRTLARGDLDLVLLVGRPGTGKSWRIRNAMDREAGAGGHLYVEGHAQPFGIYRGLWEHRDRPVVLDDVDRLYANPDCVRLLKPLCEAHIPKRLSWLSNATRVEDGPPARFETSSPVLLVANAWRSANANVRALEDRAIILSFEPSNDAVHGEAARWCTDPEVVALIGEHLRLVPHVSLRWYAKAQRLRAAGFADWRASLLQMMLGDRRLAVLSAVLTEPAYRTERARLEAFARQTGASRATYYRLKRRLQPGGPAAADGGRTIRPADEGRASAS